MRSENAVRIEFMLDPDFREDRQVIEYLQNSTNKARECRAALFDYILGSRYARQQQYISQLEHELQVLRGVVETLSSR